MPASFIVTALNVCSAILSFLITTYIYLKVSIIPINKRYRNKYVIAAGCLCIALIYIFLYPVSKPLVSLIAYLFPALFFVIFEHEQRKLKCMVAFLSSTLKRIIGYFPAVLISVLVSLTVPQINPDDNPVFEQVVILLTHIGTFFLTVLIFKIKRFRRGFQFFQDEKNLGIGIALSGILFIYFGISYTYEVKIFFLAMIGIIGFLITAFGIYLWIRRSITVRYRERLQQKAGEHYQELLDESEAKNKKLMQSNEFLAAVVHRDNHIMCSLNTSIDAYFQSDDPKQREDLLRELQTLARERGERMEQEQRERKILPSTGNMLIDSAISDLYVKATAHGIDFDLTVTAPLTGIIGKYITQTDLQTLLCDHIKDAIIAVDARGEESGRILLTLGERGGSYEMVVFDSGVDFEAETLSKLGAERVTTHADSGGSGIGFMTTFATLKKCGGSVLITEFENKHPFSKSVTFRFDGTGLFVINSYRKEELKTAINRTDIVFS